MNGDSQTFHLLSFFSKHLNLKETMNTKKVLLESDSIQANTELATRFSRALATLQNRETQVFSEIKQQIISLALKNVLGKVQNDLGPAKQATLIDQGIVKLGGQL